MWERKRECMQLSTSDQRKSVKYSNGLPANGDCVRSHASCKSIVCLSSYRIKYRRNHSEYTQRTLYRMVWNRRRENKWQQIEGRSCFGFIFFLLTMRTFYSLSFSAWPHIQSHCRIVSPTVTFDCVLNTFSDCWFLSFHDNIFHYLQWTFFGNMFGMIP